MLFCSNNRFVELPASLGECAGLDIVGFKANAIERVPASSLPESLRWLILTDNRVAALPDTLGAILAEIGRVYPPVMLANAEAVMAKAPEVTARVDGEVWTQQPFPYQAKCLGWLRQSRDRLPPQARAQVDAALAPAALTGLFA